MDLSWENYVNQYAADDNNNNKNFAPPATHIYKLSVCVMRRQLLFGDFVYAPENAVVWLLKWTDIKWRGEAKQHKPNILDSKY